LPPSHTANLRCLPSTRCLNCDRGAVQERDREQWCAQWMAVHIKKKKKIRKQTRNIRQCILLPKFSINKPARLNLSQHWQQKQKKQHFLALAPIKKRGLKLKRKTVVKGFNKVKCAKIRV
jgi:hypothetical protein